MDAQMAPEGIAYRVIFVKSFHFMGNLADMI